MIDHLSIAREVLRAEARSLDTLAASLGEEFVRLCRLLEAATGGSLSPALASPVMSRERSLLRSLPRASLHPSCTRPKRAMGTSA